jgi:pimeloyl-ACP methyl ester carboxylesterase
MRVYAPNPWETTTRSELVSIGSHKLYVSTSGTPRRKGAPVIIFLTGGGVPIAAHVRLQSILSTFARVYFYDRAGYDQSERDPVSPVTATMAGADLLELMRTIRVAPPWVIVGHSYGGIIARKFLHTTRSLSGVAGMVLIDSATELMYQTLSPIPPPDLLAVFGNLDWEALTSLREKSKLSDEEWETLVQAVQRTVPGAEAEDNHSSGRTLARRRQIESRAFGNRPLSVMRCNSAHDYQMMYDAGVKAGNGTAEQRQRAQWWIETFGLFDDELKFSQTRLSNQSRYVYYSDCGHYIVVVQPELIAEEIKWVIRQLGDDV